MAYTREKSGSLNFPMGACIADAHSICSNVEILDLLFHTPFSLQLTINSLNVTQMFKCYICWDYFMIQNGRALDITLSAKHK